MPAEELAPCGFGAFGTCCCTCANHLKLIDKCFHLGGSRECGKNEHYTNSDEFVCLIFKHERLAVKWNEHGMCEGYMEKHE